MPAEKKKYWYRFHIQGCPACGRDNSWKERVYGDKPEDPKERYIYEPDYWCGCGGY